MMDTIVLVLILAVVNYAQGTQVSETRLCAYMSKTVEQVPMHNADDDESSEDYGAADIQGTGMQQYEKCKKASNFCYALWKEDTTSNKTTSNGTGIIFMGQGCWEVSGRQDCKQETCVANKKPSKALNNTKFCCCHTDFCNMNVVDIYDATQADEPQTNPPATEYLEQSNAERQTLIISVTCGITVLVGICALVGIVMFKRWQCGSVALHKQAPDAVHLMENGGTNALHSGSYTVEHLKLSSIVGQGRYGSVWKGTVHDQEVAVKIFPGHYRNYFHNERDIYSLPFMDNPALLTYFGCDERVGLEGCVEYLLVLSYAPNGCLQDYLRTNTLDWATFCKMSLSVAKGLAHLHTDFRKGDKVKPCVSHRDLNTRNILVKGDFTCCVCDLAFAMKISGSKYFYNGEEQHAETKSINDVGTLRYMAPEVLEGAVNLRDCESSLKQIDVYALGLVLWELATRCSDLYQSGAETPPYRLPFEAEVGHHPTFEQMQVLVSRHKARPLFPELWKDWTAVKLVRETIEDSWDQDAEARLTALCVEERLQELPSLWDRQRATLYVSGVSPTVNPTSGAPQSQLTTTVRSTVNNMCGSPVVTSTLQQQGDTNRLLFLDSAGEETGGSVRSGTFGKDTRESTVSEGTVETMVTLSPTEPNPDPSCKNSNQTAVMANGYTHPMGAVPQQGPLQPYQGRNPCMERNLMLQAPSDEDLSCNGNTLVDRSFKHIVPASQLYNTSSSAFESQSLVSHDFLGMSTQQGSVVNNNSLRPATPIPYVQNAVYDSTSTPYATIPKQPNIPGNGSAFSAAVSEGNNKSSSKWGSWARNSVGWSGLRKLLDSKKRLFGMYVSRERGNSEQSNINPMVSNIPKDSDALMEADEVKSNLLVRQNSVGLTPTLKKSPVIMETQVSLLPDGKMLGSKKNSVVTSVMSPINRRNESNKNMNNNNNNSSSSEDDKASKSRRPSTLPLVSVKQPTSTSASRHSLEEHFQQVFGSQHSSSSTRLLKDPNSRVKTPGDVPPSVRRIRGKGNIARFSLYDDRMMSAAATDSATSVKSAAVKEKEIGHKFSCSVPADIDISMHTKPSSQDSHNSHASSF